MAGFLQSDSPHGVLAVARKKNLLFRFIFFSQMAERFAKINEMMAEVVLATSIPFPLYLLSVATRVHTQQVASLLSG